MLGSTNEAIIIIQRSKNVEIKWQIHLKYFELCFNVQQLWPQRLNCIKHRNKNNSNL